jgi:glutamate dehydrogenase (NAD(P)+)
MKEVLGPWTDIPAPDIGTDERVMAWIFDEFSKHKGFSPAVTTGKVGQRVRVSHRANEGSM